MADGESLAQFYHLHAYDLVALADLYLLSIGIKHELFCPHFWSSNLSDSPDASSPLFVMNILLPVPLRCHYCIMCQCKYCILLI